MSTAMLSNDYLTIAEVKRYLSISQSAAYDLANRSDFPVCRIGGCIRIPRQAFLAWVDLHTHIPSQLQSYARKGA